MTSTWQDYHRRTAGVQAALAALDTGATDVPWDAELAEVFHDRDDLLEALHAVWTRRLLARVDLELETGSGSLHDTVEDAWRATADELTALRSLLDRQAGTDVAARCVAGEHRLLAVAAGLATLSDPVARSSQIGADLVRTFAGPRPEPLPTKRFTWLRAFRHAPTAA